MMTLQRYKEKEKRWTIVKKKSWFDPVVRIFILGGYNLNALQKWSIILFFYKIICLFQKICCHHFLMLGLMLHQSLLKS